MKKYYAAFNAYGNEFDVGFANTWEVYAFFDKKSRDEWVDANDSRNTSIRSIKKSEITRYIPGCPKPFSGEFYSIETMAIDASMPGLYGFICIAPQSYSGYAAEHLF